MGRPAAHGARYMMNKRQPLALEGRCSRFALFVLAFR